MKPIHNQHYVLDGLIMRSLMLLFVTGFIAFSASASHAQGLTTNTASVTPCNNATDGPCCYNINFTSGPNGAQTLRLVFSNPGCWDWTCFQTELNAFPNITWVLNAPGDYTITFTGGLGPVTPATFHICPFRTCTNTGTVDWTAVDAIGTATGKWGFDDCSTGTQWCPDCDLTDLRNPAYYDPMTGCTYGRACYTKRRNGTASSGPFKITFTPNFNPPNHCPGWPITVCNNLPFTLWGTLVANPDGTWTFTPPPGPDGLIQPCSGFCIYIPKCGTQRTVKIEDLSDPTTPCNPPPQMVFKRAGEQDDQGHVQGASNYPNPLTSVNDFRTTIPFEIATSSEAKIAFFDETGRLVHTETSSFEGAGKHFFFFTGKELPAGTYWYTIESPIGAVIVKRTMLIIK